MGEEGAEEERAIEHQLELSIEEHKETLAAIVEALAADPSNQELLSVHEELIIAIKDAEEGLLHLKRARLLREADAVSLKLVPETEGHDIFVESLDPGLSEIEPLELEQYSVGSNCRFRHSDGRWYDGCIIGFENVNSARISFLIPTSESMLMCKFFLQERCRFGNNCRMSHGIIMPVSSLQHYTPTLWQPSLVGSSIVAAPSGPHGLWKSAELQAWDDKLKLAKVVFDDGSSAYLGTDALALSEYAHFPEEEEEDSSSEESRSDSDEYTTDAFNQGLGFLDSISLQSGVQKETALFATWENHTRGIASKMMASMGYREGMGLGISGQGMVDPISVRVLPAKLSLDHALESNKVEDNEKGSAKKRSRGGRRKREKKYAEAARAAKAEREPEPDVFSFINEQLADGNRVGIANKQRKVCEEDETSTKKEDRRSLVAHEDKIKELRFHVERLEGTVNRNRKDKVIYESASRRLSEARNLLADAEAAHASASHAVVSKEKEKRWLKF